MTRTHRRALWGVPASCKAQHCGRFLNLPSNAVVCRAVDSPAPRLGSPLNARPRRRRRRAQLGDTAGNRALVHLAADLNGVYTRGNWPSYHAAIEAEWRPYLQGHVTMQRAISGMVDKMPQAESARP
jgi:hypothetical protein